MEGQHKRMEWEKRNEPRPLSAKGGGDGTYLFGRINRRCLLL